MSTRGLYGFHMNGQDKTTYNHYDSYPDGLGSDIALFCTKTTVQEMKELFSKIQMVKENEVPTPEQKEFCKRSGIVDFSVSNRSEDDWYCLLRKVQGNLNALKGVANKTGWHI